MNGPDSSERLVARNLASLALERLETAIVEGELAPGERLSESGLARRFGISRGPLREAIGQLEGRKLVTREVNLGARVVALSVADLMDLMEVRESLEGMACRLAASRATDAELGRLAQMLDAHAEADDLKTGRGYFQGAGDKDFHNVILEASGNARLSTLLGEDLYALLRLYRRRLSTRPGRAADALAEHRAILAALQARDPEGAEAAMRAHIRASREAARDWLAKTDLARTDLTRTGPARTDLTRTDPARTDKETPP
ncbi:MAG: GntR family transcriptional regulator [Pseudomonadota bacterium]